MKSYSEYVTPGSPLRMSLGGRLMYVQRSEAGFVLDIKFKAGGNVQSVARVGKGFRAAPMGGFDAIEIAASAPGLVEFVITDGDVQLQFDEERTKIESSTVDPVFVRLSQDLLPLGSVTVNNADAAAIPVQQKVGAVFTTQSEKLGIIVDHDKAIINAGAAQMLIAEPTFKRLRIKNASATARVALGGAALTMSNAAIILEPGDVWIEDDAAGATWYAVSDIAGADVRVMGVK